MGLALLCYLGAQGIQSTALEDLRGLDALASRVWVQRLGHLGSRIHHD
jgi:hypothetical protein